MTPLRTLLFGGNRLSSLSAMGWLVSDTANGAITGANLYLIVETAKAKSLEPAE
jgi:hypothetical protein